ncbi:MAG: zinc-binding dehydrogenase [Clostridia bacterium]|nr:zinc-binding dehydrogenase [Clostridia bacterium]
MNKQILFTAPNVAELVFIEDQPLKPDEVRVRTAVHTMSNGTERANLTGDPNISCAGKPKVVFPRAVGYSCAGEIIEMGSAVTDFAIGDRVAVSWSKYKAVNALPAGKVSKLPENVSYEDAAFCHIATFPLAAIRKTRLEIGEPAMVMGLGILGMIGVQLLKTAGAAPVIAADPNPARREKALTCGADYALDPFAPDFAEQVKSLTGGIKVAIEVTGAGAALDETLDCMAPLGRVALLGCTRDKNFTIDYYRKVHGPGISLIGAHTLARPKQESSAGLFTDKDDRESILKLLSLGRLNFRDLVDETHAPEKCGEVFHRLAFEKDFPCMVQFDWRKQ